MALHRARHLLSKLSELSPTLASQSCANARVESLQLPALARFSSSGLGLETGVPRQNLAGRTFLVTGSTDGIGLHTSHLLAQSGATVLVHGRSLHKVKKVIKTLRADTNNKKVFGYCYDLAKLDAVRSFAEHVRSDAAQFFDNKLHCLLNNAGVFLEDKEISPDGMEMTWAVNVAAPFLLTGQLLDLVLNAHGRILNVSSISLADSLDFKAKPEEDAYERMGHAAYGISKLALNMWSYALAERLKGRVTVNCVDPGTVTTKLLFAGWGDVSYAAMRVDEADDEYWAATDPSLEGMTGRYFVNRQQRKTASQSYDKAAQQQLWEMLERQTGAAFPVPEDR